MLFTHYYLFLVTAFSPPPTSSYCLPSPHLPLSFAFLFKLGWSSSQGSLICVALPTTCCWNPSPSRAERAPRMADFFYTTKERSTRGEITRGFGYHLQSCLCVHSFGLPVLSIPFILFLPLILYSVRPPVL